MKKRFFIFLFLVPFFSCTIGQGGGPSGDESCQPAVSTQRHGFNLTCWYRGCFQEEETGASLDALKEVGGGWLAIVPTWYQDSLNASAVYEHPVKSATADDLRSVVSLARDKGLQVLLKPHIDIVSGGWRGEIAPADLVAWQASYRDFLLHFAALSEELGIEVLVIGTELKKRSGDESFWRSLIEDVRSVYNGKLTYAANWDEFEAVGFWDLLDFVGIDFYYPLTEDTNATQEAMEGALQLIRSDLKAFSDQTGKPFLFTEIGYRSVDGTNVKPYDFESDAPADPQEQADAYAAVLTVFENESWVEGIFWWRWDPRITAGASDEGYFVYQKPAADVLKQFWLGSSCFEQDENQRPSSNQTVSFVTFGDWGTGGDDQKEVAGAMEDYCQQEECEFVLTLGDNFYSNGVESTTDEQWKEKYQDVYGGFGLPFYASLGNHDNDGNIQAQIDYSDVDSTWHMPAEDYSFVMPENSNPPLVEFFVFNSDYPHFRDESVQDWLTEAIHASRARWKVLVMHHPIYSDGNHGDDDQGNNEFLLPIICNKIDLILSGHDHNFAYLQANPDGCKIEQLVIGTGGAKIRDTEQESEATVVSRGNFHGFGWLEVGADEILFRMVTTDGTVFYSTSFTE